MAVVRVMEVDMILEGDNVNVRARVEYTPMGLNTCMVSITSTLYSGVERAFYLQ